MGLCQVARHDGDQTTRWTDNSMSNADLESIILKPDERIVFHGTQAFFGAFDESYLGRGGDRNSELGFHFADTPSEASEYRRDGSVLAVGAVTENPFVEPDYYAFFGYDQNGEDIAGKGHFAVKRLQLLKEGYDAVEYEDSEQTICVVLKSSAIRILAELSEAEAEAVHEAIRSLPDMHDDAARLAILKEVVLARNPAPQTP